MLVIILLAFSRPPPAHTGDGCAACTADANEFCPGVLATEGKTALVACLDAVYDDLLPRCRHQLDEHADLNNDVKVECNAYLYLCADIEPDLGSEPCFDTLRADVGTSIPEGSTCDLSLEAQAASQLSCH